MIYETWSITQMSVPNLDKWMRAKLMAYVGMGSEYSINLRPKAQNKLHDRAGELHVVTLRLLLGLQLLVPLRYVAHVFPKELLEDVVKTEL